MFQKFILVIGLWILVFNDASCFAEARKLRFFNIDLHIAVIGDLKDIFESLGHEVESKSISGHAWVLGKDKDKPKVINEKNWENLNPEMAEQFYQEYKDYLSQFDGFIVTHATSFALLYEKFNKPIIIVNSTRYENNFVKDPVRWKWLNNFLIKGVNENRIFIISNNKGDQAYLKYYTGLDSELIPNLCLYTKAVYTGKNKGFIMKGVRRRFNPSPSLFKNPELIQNNQLPKNYKWQELYDFQGVIHFPYNISTMSVFEQYSANVPLFFPSKDFLLKLRAAYPKAILSELSFYQVFKMKPPKEKNNPDNTNDPKVIQKWIDEADFYDQENMPYIQYFDSFSDLENKLENSDLKLISSQMKKHNEQRKKIVYKKWQEILDKIMQTYKNATVS